MTADRLIAISRRLSDAVDALSFGPPVHTTYNPLAYARAPHEAFIRRYGDGRKRFVWLGMNPGPFGMGQTGVPFGDVVAVRDWLGIQAPVEQPALQHPKRPIVGFDLTRREGSGKRLWGWAEERFGTADAFFADTWVHNYCPLFFTHETGRNIIPEKLARDERDAVLGPCDAALREVVDAVGAEVVVGVGAFAAKRAAQVLEGTEVQIAQILHPSPASPLANAGWAEQVEPVLRGLGYGEGWRA